ncbi:MAG: acyltransferase [Silvibacterium sp.]
MQIDKRNAGLDVLRAAAILGVVLSHNMTVNFLGRDIMLWLGVGVDLFFVLSGFLIGRIYFRSIQGGSFSFWEFWRSRWWRTLPPYFAAVVVYLVARKVAPYPGLAWYYIFFLQNYLGITAGPGSGGFAPSWSLCVEEHFYLLLPLLVLVVALLFGRRRLRYVLPIAILAPMVLRAITLALIRPLPLQWNWFSHLHCEGLITGVYLAYLFVEDRAGFDRVKILAKWLLPVAPITLIVVTFWDLNLMFARIFLFTIFAVGFGAWVRYLYDLKWDPVSMPGRLAKASAHGIALCSYSVYLTHTTVDPIIRTHLVQSLHRGVVKSFIVLWCTFLLGIIFYFVVERPTIISRNRYLKGKRRPFVDARPAVEVS